MPDASSHERSWDRATSVHGYSTPLLLLPLLRLMGRGAPDGPTPPSGAACGLHHQPCPEDAGPREAHPVELWV
jgi:hypothetical protein